MGSRVLILCSASYVSGKEIVTFAHAVGLRDAGHDVRVIVSTWSNGDFARRLEAAGIRWCALPTGFISRQMGWFATRSSLLQGLLLPRLWWRYARLLREFRPDVVLHTNFHHVFLLLPFCRRDRDWMVVHEGFPDLRFYRLLLQGFARRLAGFVAVAHYVGRVLRERGVPADQVVVIRNGTSVPAEVPVRVPAAALRLAIVGQVGPWKGHHDAIVALGILCGRGRDVRLLIFGMDKDGYSDVLRGEIAARGLTDRVEWRGFVSDRAAIYREVDVLLVPSRFEEPFGLVAVEAGAHEVPVVVAASGELPSLVLEGVTGFVVPKESPAAIADAVERLLDPEVRARMGRAARTQALREFTDDRMIRELRSLVSAQAPAALAAV